MSDHAVEKLSKKDKKEKKRRDREDDEADKQRRHKRSKSEAIALDQAPIASEIVLPERKKKKHKKEAEAEVNGEAAAPPSHDAQHKNGALIDETAELDKAARKKAKKEKRKNKEAGDSHDQEPKGEDAPENNPAALPSEEKKKRRRKPKKDKDVKAETEDAEDAASVAHDAFEEQPEDAADTADGVDEAASAKKLAKEKRKQSKKQKVSSSLPHQSDTIFDDETGDPMDVDLTPRKVSSRPVLQPADAPKEPAFPFFTSTISLYVPLYPIGFDQPLTSAAEQHLKPLVNHYAPSLGGVLLGYKNVNLSEEPRRPDPEHPPSDSTGALLTSVDEYAVGFGWLTSDVDLFVPKRGAWLEGKVILQSEGSIGVLCWNRYNASIEAKRLPKGWKYIDLVKLAEDGEKARARGLKPPAPPSPPPEDSDDDELQEEDMPMVAQKHATGYWVDENRRAVRGNLRFRIKSFDCGLAGDHGYLSIEGTMLTLDEEKEIAAEEMIEERQRKQRTSGSVLIREARRLPEFSMTEFGREDQEEDSGQRKEIYQGSRLQSPE